MDYSRARQGAILVSLFLAWVVAYADRIAISTSIIPIAKEFALDTTTTGYVLSSFYVTYALMQLGGGWLSDRFGSRHVLVFCIVCWSVFTGLTSMAWSVASLIAVRLLFGLGEGAFSPASSVTIAEVFPKHERARAKSFVISSVMLGNVVGTAVVSWAIYSYGWRTAYYLLALVGIVVAVGFWMTLRNSKKPATKMWEADPGPRFWPLLRMPMVRKIVLIWFFMNIVALGLQSWMPSYLMRVHQIDIVHAGIAAAIPSLVAFFGLNCVGWILDKVGGGKERLFMAIGAMLNAAFLAMMTSTDSIVLLVLYWTLSTLAYNVVYATLFAIPLRHVGENMIGSATGMMNFGGQVAGAVAPTVMGFLITYSNGSFLPAFLFLVGSGVMASMIALTWRPDEASQDLAPAFLH